MKEERQARVNTAAAPPCLKVSCVCACFVARSRRLSCEKVSGWREGEERAHARGGCAAVHMPPPHLFYRRPNPSTHLTTHHTATPNNTTQWPRPPPPPLLPRPSPPSPAASPGNPNPPTHPPTHPRIHLTHPPNPPTHPPNSTSLHEAQGAKTFMAAAAAAVSSNLYLSHPPTHPPKPTPPVSHLHT